MPMTASPSSMARAAALIKEAGGQRGIALVAGLRDGMLVKALALRSNFHVIAIDENPGSIARLRDQLKRAGLYGVRATAIQADPGSISLPPYLARIITTETPNRMANSWGGLLPSLRPYGGIAALGLEPGVGFATAENLKALKPGRFELAELNGKAQVRRVGALPGSAQYQGGYEPCEDALVRFPLGVLWFDDSLSHFKRSPQPHFMDGVMVSRPKDWQAPRVKGDWSIDYPLRGAILSDIYTGRILDASESSGLRKKLPDIGRSTPQPSYYHAPHQKTYLNPDPPLVGERVNPLTGLKEPRVFPKTYGCDGGVDYGSFYTCEAERPRSTTRPWRAARCLSADLEAAARTASSLRRPPERPLFLRRLHLQLSPASGLAMRRHARTTNNGPPGATIRRDRIPFNESASTSARPAIA